MAKKIKEKKIPRFISASEFPKYVTRREFVEIGIVYKSFNYITHAGQKKELAKKYFPIMIYVNQFILCLSLVSVVVLFVSLKQNESPTVFANFNNGKLMCSNEPIDINNNEKPIGRESKRYNNICSSLQNFDTQGEQ